MTDRPVLLDTDILSAIMRADVRLGDLPEAYLQVHRCFSISIVTKYEILRGLLTKNATKQQLLFDQFCESNVVLPLSDAIVNRAAQIYADLRQRGRIVGDGDIFIAATALVHNYPLVTN